MAWPQNACEPAGENRQQHADSSSTRAGARGRATHARGTNGATRAPNGQFCFASTQSWARARTERKSATHA
eukprot:11191869-Lingulodinium_polyedra.AAC.1